MDIEKLKTFFKSGVIFTLDVCHVVDIRRFSAFHENERLVLPGTPMEVLGMLPLAAKTAANPMGATMIQLKQDLACPPLLPLYTLKVRSFLSSSFPFFFLSLVGCQVSGG